MPRPGCRREKGRKRIRQGRKRRRQGWRCQEASSESCTNCIKEEELEGDARNMFSACVLGGVIGPLMFGP